MAQADGVVANGTGAAVRADLNDQLAAVFTNHSGSSEPSTTYAYQWWADTTSNTLKLRNSANNGWVTLRELDGTMLIEDGTASLPGLAFADDTNTGIFSGGADEINISTGGTERVVVNSSGNVGIGTTSPGANLHVRSSGATEIKSESTGDNALVSINNSSSVPWILTQRSDTSNGFSFRYSGNNYVNIDTSGNVGIGVTSISNIANRSQLEIGGSAGGLMDFKVGSDTEGRLFASDGSFNIRAAQSDGNLVFQTAGQNERVRIDSSGRLLVGTSSSSQYTGTDSSIQLTSSSSGNDPRIQIKGNATTDIAAIDFGGGAQRHGTIQGADGGLEFYSNSAAGAGGVTQRMNIESTGRVEIGAFGSGSANENLVVINTSDPAATFRRNTTTGTIVNFKYNSPIVGSISTNGTTTAYNTSSDYRLKENVVDINDGIVRVKQLAPKRFNFIVDADTTVDGFLAHEAQTVVPEAVTGTHDEVDDDGNPVMQGIDQSKLVPLLTAALQEAIAKIETLEVKVAALEAG